MLDLAVPRDFDPAIGSRPDVYLYSIDDLQAACQRNRAERDKELPAAMRIIDQETGRFMGDLVSPRHRPGDPAASRRAGRSRRKRNCSGCWTSCRSWTTAAATEVRRSFDRLVNKLLHPPLESLRDESRHGIPHVLLDALARLFQLKD